MLHEGRVHCLAVHKEKIASGGSNKDLNIWNASTGERVCSPLNGHDGWILCI